MYLVTIRKNGAILNNDAEFSTFNLIKDALEYIERANDSRPYFRSHSFILQEPYEYKLYKIEKEIPVDFSLEEVAVTRTEKKVTAKVRE